MVRTPLNIALEVKMLREAIEDRGVNGDLQGNVTGNLTAASGADLAINGATGKDVKVKLTDAAGARKLEVIDSADTLVFSVDSDGNVIANKFIGPGNYATAALVGTPPTNAQMITAFGAVSGNAGVTGIYNDSSAPTKIYSCACNGAKYAATLMTDGV
jgi:hypothetical protein